MEKFYIIEYMGLFLQLNKSGNCFVSDMNLANRVIDYDNAIEWLNANQEEYSHLSFLLTLVKCEFINGDWDVSDVKVGEIDG